MSVALCDLKLFCGDARSYQGKPFCIAGIGTAALNGYVAVVVPGEVQTSEIVPDDVAAAFSRWKDLPAENGIALGAIKLPKPKKCQFCKNDLARRFAADDQPCPDCDGEGEFGHGRHIYECRECRGNGRIGREKDVPICPNCQGTGFSFQAVTAGRAAFQRRYLVLLGSLAGVTLYPNGPENIAKFTFDGGWGVLMPCRI